MAKSKTEVQTPAVQAALSAVRSAQLAARKASAIAAEIAERRQDAANHLPVLKAEATRARESARFAKTMADMDSLLADAKRIDAEIADLEATLGPLAELHRRADRDASCAESLSLDAQRALFCIAFEEERDALLAELPPGLGERLLAVAGTWWRTDPSLGHQAPWPAFLAALFQDPGREALTGSHDVAQVRLGLEAAHG